MLGSERLVFFFFGFGGFFRGFGLGVVGPLT